MEHRDVVSDKYVQTEWADFNLSLSSTMQWQCTITVLLKPSNFKHLPSCSSLFLLLGPLLFGAELMSHISWEPACKDKSSLCAELQPKISGGLMLLFKSSRTFRVQMRREQERRCLNRSRTGEGGVGGDWDVLQLHLGRRRWHMKVGRNNNYLIPRWILREGQTHKIFQLLSLVNTK